MNSHAPVLSATVEAVAILFSRKTIMLCGSAVPESSAVVFVATTGVSSSSIAGQSPETQASGNTTPKAARISARNVTRFFVKLLPSSLDASTWTSSRT